VSRTKIIYRVAERFGLIKDDCMSEFFF